MTYDDTPLEGVDKIVSETGSLGTPTGEVGWCYECDCMMSEVRWADGKTEWICFSLMRELGEGIWQINPNLYG